MTEPWDLWMWRQGKLICASYIVSVMYLQVAWLITNALFKLLFGG